MHTPFFRKGLMAAAAALALAAPALAAELVSNGGFEAGSLSGWSGTVLTSPYSGVYCPGAGSAPEGTCVTFLGTDGTTDTLSQVLATVAGQSYVVSFTFVSDGSAATSFAAAFGGTSLYSVTSPAAAAAQTLSFTVTAGSNASALVFSYSNDPGYFHLDAVSVTAAPVPEPAPAALGALGLIGIGGLLARRRRTARGR